jgi:ubiquinone/menaquinone biosynthesis C-methylase UbiE
MGTGVGALIPDLRAEAACATIVAVDRSEGMLRLARENGTRFNVPLALMDAQQVAIASSMIDVAILAFMLFHVAEPHQALLEIKRVLRPGGTIGTVTWGKQERFPAEVVWDEELDAHGAGPDPVASIRHDDLMDTPDKIAALLGNAGFAQTRAWTQRFEHQWGPEAFFAEYGAQRRKLETVQPNVREACVARIRERLTGMSDRDFLFTPEIVFATARSSASFC